MKTSEAVAEWAGLLFAIFFIIAFIIGGLR
jgi:hypothetical protein